MGTKPDRFEDRNDEGAAAEPDHHLGRHRGHAPTPQAGAPMSSGAIATAITVVSLVIAVCCYAYARRAEDEARRRAGLPPRRRWWRRPSALPGREP
jgi:hypothetical protein